MDYKTLQKGQLVNDKFAVVKIEEKVTSQGNAYANLILSNPNGTIGGKIWKEVLSSVHIESGKVYQINSIVDVFNNNTGLNIKDASITNDPIENFIFTVPTIVFDIETAGQDFTDLNEWDQDYLLNHLQKHEPDKEKAKQSTALFPLYAQVVSIGLYNPKTQKGQTLVLAGEEITLENTNFTCLNFPEEKDLLIHFWQVATKYKRFITYNGNRFDFPFLALRSAFHKIKVPLDLNPYQENFIDLMQKFGNGFSFKLEALCRFFQISNPKDKGVSGLHVSNLFKKGEIKAIADYVARDVISTEQLYQIWRQYLAGKIIV